VTHLEGRDVVLLSPGKAATATAGEIQLAGQVAFARRYADGTLRLAVVKGAGAVATEPPWSLRSDGPVAISIRGATVDGSSSGDAHAAHVALPPAYGAALVTVDGKPAAAKREGNLLSLDLPAGYHSFSVKSNRGVGASPLLPLPR
jgi:hypothetical protein